eukprot:1144743-Prymnesium_polylepis.1
MDSCAVCSPAGSLPGGVVRCRDDARAERGGRLGLFPRAIAYLKHVFACETQGKYESLSLALA